QYRLQRPDPICDGRRSRQPQGGPPVRAVQPGDPAPLAPHYQNLRCAGHPGYAVRRDGRPAPLLSAALWHGAAPLQHESSLCAAAEGIDSPHHAAGRAADRRAGVADENGGRDPRISDPTGTEAVAECALVGYVEITFRTIILTLPFRASGWHARSLRR